MIHQDARDNLITIASAYAGATGLTLSAVSKRFHGSNVFLQQLKDGECTITLKKLGSMLVEFSERWPVGIKWPTVRPVPMGRVSKADITAYRKTNPQDLTE